MNDFDSIDLQIMNELQRDCTRSVEEIGRVVGLSQSPCWRRIRRLEEAGVIGARVALIDPQKVGLGVTVFMTVRTNQHSEEWIDEFAEAVADIPEIVEIYRMSGDVDYLLKVLASDIASFDRVYKKLIGRIQLHDVSSSFAMERLKYSTLVPVLP
jgi:Lrp/AsnC family transcriptional regulator